MEIVNVYSGNLYGGVERMLVAMARSGRFSNHSFLLCFEGRLAGELREARARIAVLPSARLRNPLTVRRFRKAFAREIEQRHESRIVCHGVWSYCLAAAAARKLGHQPVLFLHNVPEPSKALYRWAWLAPPALCITNSEFVRGRLASLRGPVKTAVVHPLSPATVAPAQAEVERLRDTWGVAREEVVILQASRLEAGKGHRTLLRALGKMRHVPGWKAWIAGAPQRPDEERYLHELVGLASSAGIGDRVRFIGHRSDMPLVLTASDVYCQPNELPEGFGMVFVEALALGKPVVASDVGGVREIVDASCGILCAPDVVPLAGALENLVSNRQLRDRMGDAGAAKVEKLFGLEAFERSLNRALAQVGEGARSC